MESPPHPLLSLASQSRGLVGLELGRGTGACRPWKERKPGGDGWQDQMWPQDQEKRLSD